MKKIIVILLFCPIIISAQNPNWSLQKHLMNLAILVLDYQTYNLLGGNFSVHKPCIDCDTSALPFRIEYNNPTDFGDITFYYHETNEVLFAATIVWMGRGGISIPHFLLPKVVFQIENDPKTLPQSFDYFEYTLDMDSTILKLKADSAWHSIKKLDIVNDFSFNKYRVGIYLYPPAVGEFDPTYAKWIIFLYQGRISPINVRQNVELDNVNIRCSPNPFFESTNVEFYHTYPSFVKIDIYNTLGKKITNLLDQYMDQGINTVVFDASEFPAGVYFCTLRAGSYTETVKMVVVR
ncbi:T9SS type A sorting domain-containing protein [Bacteroidota bacterium]